MSTSKEIKQLTFGVSYDFKFRLLDMWGEIADDLLYHNKYFSPEFFPNISSQYTTERSLSNPDKGHRLVITANNLVFTQTIINDYHEEYLDFKNRVIEYIVPKILSSKSLVIQRLGVVYVSELDQSIIQRFASMYFRPEVQGISDFRFSKKETTESGLILNGSNDFINKIYTVGNLGGIAQGISYDFQVHFSPKRQDVRDTINHFMTSAQSHFERDICLIIED